MSYEEIEKILVGDAEAMNALVKLYTPYIKVLSYGDKEIEDMVIAKLMKAAMQLRFDYER